ncbi:hypothetical protein IC229_31465 [Spirosoma sp. BT702]|uniref:Uncharacterized protein n=1 Tax=Spirosoma profusum TaxID=2771354 RepID=A0A927AVG9_9BACT|nr:hypothetical protein [Spirosoma profusum]MBD2705183.1 hypothetical protein [Spirosoma profusum]
MKSLFHLIFEIIKIGVLSSAYALLLLVILKLVQAYSSKAWVNRVLRNKVRFWLYTTLSISVALFFFMFTYYGDHGLGDSSRLPIGYGKDVKQINGTDTFIESEDGGQLGITIFNYDNSYLYAEIQKQSDEENRYVVWNLRTDDWIFYKTKGDYVKYVTDKNYIPIDKFEDFTAFYRTYWGGWRFIFLP